MSEDEQVVADLIEVVWRRGDLDALGDFYSTDCVNHAADVDSQVGLSALRRYHEGMLAAFAEFDGARIEILQQVGASDRVATHMMMSASHRATGTPVSMASIRIDRFENGKIIEHWSVADLAGLQAQLTGSPR